MKTNWLKHLRDILILPFTVTVIVPYFIYQPSADPIPAMAVRLLGIVIGLFGITLFANTIYLFAKVANGTLAPWSEKQKLVVVGPYRYCRNPMISGVFFVLAGEALFFASWQLAIWVGIFFAINTIYFMLVEEVNLQLKFGQSYIKYKASVPRWLPRLTAYQG